VQVSPDLKLHVSQHYEVTLSPSLKNRQALVASLQSLGQVNR
jgi:predicted Zn-dependent protease